MGWYPCEGCGGGPIGDILFYELKIVIADLIFRIDLSTVYTETDTALEITIPWGAGASSVGFSYVLEEMSEHIADWEFIPLGSNNSLACTTARTAMSAASWPGSSVINLTNGGTTPTFTTVDSAYKKMVYDFGGSKWTHSGSPGSDDVYGYRATVDGFDAQDGYNIGMVRAENAPITMDDASDEIIPEFGMAVAPYGGTPSGLTSYGTGHSQGLDVLQQLYCKEVFTNFNSGFSCYVFENDVTPDRDDDGTEYTTGTQLANSGKDMNGSTAGCEITHTQTTGRFNCFNTSTTADGTAYGVAVYNDGTFLGAARLTTPQDWTSGDRVDVVFDVDVILKTYTNAP